MGDTVSHAVLPGVVLGVAMLIIPGATAHLLTDRFGRMLLIAPTISVFASVTGGRTRPSTVMPCSAQKDISRGSASEMLGDGMLEVPGLVVDLLPAVAEGRHQERLD